MSDPFFFGYGSLVNLETHTYPAARPARVMGWRRAWRGTVFRDLAFLTAEPDPEARIDGMIAAVPDADWTALDERERAYVRHRIPDTHHGLGGDHDIQIYAVAPKNIDDAHAHPILLSYLDTVVQGYLQIFGEAGAIGFFDTTFGWRRPVVNDRANPIYPRATRLSDAERELVDAQLSRVGALPA